MTEEHSKYIKKFYCVECRDKNSHLAVVYKSKYADKIKELKESKKSKKHKEDRDKDRDRERKKHKHDRKNETEEERRIRKEKERRESRKTETEEERRVRKEKERREKDRDDNKEREREKEREKQIMEKYKEREKEKTKIPKIPKIPKLGEVDSKTPTSSELKVKQEPDVVKIKKEEEKPKKVEPIAHKRLDEVKRERSKSVDKKEPPEKVRKVLAAKEENKVLGSSSEEDRAPLQSVSQPPSTKPVKEKPAVKRKLSKDARNDLAKKRKGWRAARGRESSDDSETEVDLSPRQCYGMDCVLTARVASKYCSDQCGLSLASLRIYQTLPERIREWNLTKCSATQTNQKELVKIRSQLTTAREKLEEVDRQVEELEQLIARVKKLAPQEKDSDDSSDEEEDDKKGGTVNCISCGKVSLFIILKEGQSFILDHCRMFPTG